ncbi:AAA family ATPase [candidate division WOR-3 bacterium]|nr:AAA family ATPase [candidate division WOR-3 bacterium]
MSNNIIGPEPTVQSRVNELLEPALYGGGVKRVRLIQTHTSWVFIAGDFAYKVKKPVNFGFLDYTTLSARRFFCYEELRLNRYLSPDLYLGVVPIVERKGRLRLGGGGRVIDYCVKMRALPQRAIMTERLKRGEVSFQHIDEIARRISEFHRKAERGKQVAQYGSSEIIKLNWDENFAQTMEFRGKTISPRMFQEIKGAVERFIAENRDTFRDRRQRGFVRRCHGDLHSKNIFLADRVYIFDCIEFNPRFSCGDVASEVAFMAMDLDFFNRHDLANFFLERYLVYSEDRGFLKLLDFYRCYRAYVRGKVTSFQLNDPTVPQRAKKVALVTARRYFALASRYARLMTEKNWLMVVFGLPGVGKSYLAKRFAMRRLAIHLLSDSIRKQLLGIPIDESRFEGYGKGIYTADVSKRTYEELLKRAEIFLRGKQSVILDATFLSPETRNRCRELAQRLGVKVLFVWANCPEKTVERRLQRRAKEGGFSDANLEVYQAMKARFQPPEDRADLITVDTRVPITKLFKKIERALLYF